MDEIIHNLIQTLDDSGIDFYAAGPFDASVVLKAQSKLGLIFPRDYCDFLMLYGACSFGSCEIYGITSDDLSIDSIPNAIWYTLELRRSGLPRNMVVIGWSDLYVDSIRQVNLNEWDVVRCDRKGIILPNTTAQISATFSGYLIAQLGTVLRTNNP